MAVAVVAISGMIVGLKVECEDAAEAIMRFVHICPRGCLHIPIKVILRYNCQWTIGNGLRWRTTSKPCFRDLKILAGLNTVRFRSIQYGPVTVTRLMDSAFR